MDSLVLSCGNSWRRRRSRVQAGILHEAVWRQLSSLNLVRYANLKGIRSPVESIAPVAGCVMSVDNSGAENLESHRV